MAGPGPGHHGGKGPITPSKKKGIAAPQKKTPKTPSTKNTPAKIAKRSQVKKTPSKLAKEKAVDSDDEEEVKEVKGYVRKTEPPRMPGVLYARDLSKIRNTPPKDIFERDNILDEPYHEDKDEIMANMHPESKRLAIATDKHMNDIGEGYTFGSYAASARKNGNVEEDSDDYDEEGMVAAGLASARKPSSGKGRKGDKTGMVGKGGVPEHEEKFWMNAKGALIRIDPNDPEQPTACNNVEREKKNGPKPIDPNGRFIGRHLVNWHRERMMEKLLLNIQFESHKAGIDLPWDKIVHRLNPGSSGPSAVQMLNKLREVLIMEGHMIPPAMGKRTMKTDPMVRGYVRDLTQKDPRAARILYWTEPYENAKNSLTDHGHIVGSGVYRQLQMVNPAVKKEQGGDDDESDVYSRPAYIPVAQRQLENRLKSGDGYRQYAGVVRNARIKKEVTSDEDEDEYMVILPEELDPDDDYDPTPSKKRGKSGRRQPARTRVRRAPKVETDNDEEEEEIVQESSSSSDADSDDGVPRSLIVKLPIAVNIGGKNDATKEEDSPSVRLAKSGSSAQGDNDVMETSVADAAHEIDHQFGLGGVDQGMGAIPLNNGGFSASFPSASGMYTDGVMSSNGLPASNNGTFGVSSSPSVMRSYTADGTYLHSGHNVATLMPQSHGLLGGVSQSFSGYPVSNDFDHANRYNHHQMIVNGALGANFNYMSFGTPAPANHNVDHDGFAVGDGSTIGAFARRDTPETDHDEI